MLKGLRTVLREWPMIGALAALLSLAFLPRFLSTDALVAQHEAEEFDALRRLADTGPHDPAAAALRDFLHRRPGSAFAGEARYLLARLAVLRSRRGDFPGLEALDEAWTSARLARETGFDAARTFDLQREIAALLSERDLSREAVERYTELVHGSNEPADGLGLARALARRATREPAVGQAFLDEASARVSDFLARVPAERRIEGFLTQSDLYYRLGRHEEMLRVLERALAEAVRPEDRGLLQLEIGKALLRLSRPGEARNLEAFTALEDALELLPDECRDEALLLQALLHAREGRSRALELCSQLIQGSSRLAPLAQLVVGLQQLREGREEALESLRLGLVDVRRPRLFDDHGFDVADLLRSLRRAWEPERDPARLERFAGLLAEIRRLYPSTVEHRLDHAALLRRAGRCSAAADEYEAAAPLLPDAQRDHALREAAESCFEGRLYLRAAVLYRAFHDLRPGPNAEGLFQEGESLRRAGRYGGALSALQEYIAAAPRGDRRAHAARLSRARMLVELGRREDAAAEYRAVLRADEGIQPLDPEWADALLGLGRTLLDLAGESSAPEKRLPALAEGRRALEELLERYRSPGAVEAAALLARAEIAERRWDRALERLETLASLADLVPGSDDVRRGGFLRGDVLSALGRWEEAARAYGEAYRRSIDHDERLWGLIGRARAELRLGRPAEARRHYETAAGLHEEGRDRYDRSLDGRGRAWWTGELAELAGELP